jgi:hypothetical protein
MRNDQISTANYAAVIADLRVKRDELDRTIRMLETMAQLGTPPVVQSAPAAVSVPERASTVSVQRPWLPRPQAGRSNGIGEECTKILRENASKGPLSTRQVTDLLLGSGFKLEAKTPANNVHSALNHRSKVSGDVERVGSNWRYIGELEKGGGTDHVSGQTSQEVNGSAVPFFTR